MKKTVNINLGGFAFQIDEDAFDRLNQYIESLKNKFSNLEEQEEIIQDIEYRFAELFGNEMTKAKEVVSLDLVNEVITTMGEAEEIDDSFVDEQQNAKKQNSSHSTSNKKLFRDPDDKIFAGVLSGVSKYFGIQDAIWLRITMIVLTIASVGIPTVLIYIILWIVMPEAKTASEKLQMKGEAINLDNIEEQVKKNINSEEIKKASVKVANTISSIFPVVIKVVGVLLLFLFGIKLILVSTTLLGGALFINSFNTEVIQLVFSSKLSYFIGVAGLYILISLPIIFAIGLCIRLISRKKVNWVLTFSLVVLGIIVSIIGISYASADVFTNFKNHAEQTNYTALSNPTVDELEILFPYAKLENELKLSIDFGKNTKGEALKIEGIKVNTNEKTIHVDAVNLRIVKLDNDTIFKLSKTLYSNGKTIEQAEENLSHIRHDFENVSENMIAIPNRLILENETKWRNQHINYTLYVPVGKKVHFGGHAKKIINIVTFNGDFSRKDLSNNTWEMTEYGMKCLTCDKN